MLFLKRNRVFIAFFSFIAIFWLPSQYIPQVNENYCKVYQAYASDFEVEYPSAFLPFAKSFPENSFDWMQPNFIYTHENGNDRFAFEVEKVFGSDWKENWKAKLHRIRFCFDETTNTPTVLELPKGSIEYLKFSINSLDIDMYSEHKLADNIYNLHHVSVPLISADGRYAILYSTVECGGLCGGSAFHLYEKINDDWKLIGRNVLSVS
jgi:hypothetical protein